MRYKSNVMETTSKNTTTRNSRSLLRIGNAYDTWLLDSKNAGAENALITAFRDLLGTINAISFEPETYRLFVQKFITFCHQLIERDIELSAGNKAVVRHILLKRRHWLFALEQGDEKLVAAVVLSASAQTGNKYYADYTSLLAEWKKCGLIMHDTNARQNVARILFGDTWASLCADDITSDFKANYRLLEQMHASFTSTKENCSDALSVDVPKDII